MVTITSNSSNNQCSKLNTWTMSSWHQAATDKLSREVALIQWPPWAMVSHRVKMKTKRTTWICRILPKHRWWIPRSRSSFKSSKRTVRSSKLISYNISAICLHREGLSWRIQPLGESEVPRVRMEALISFIEVWGRKCRPTTRILRVRKTREHRNLVGWTESTGSHQLRPSINKATKIVSLLATSSTSQLRSKARIKAISAAPHHRQKLKPNKRK